MKRPEIISSNYESTWNRIIYQENPLKFCDDWFQKKVLLPKDCINPHQLEIVTAIAHSAMERGFETFYSASFSHPRAHLNPWKGNTKLLTVEKPKNGFFSRSRIISQTYIPDGVHYDTLVMRVGDGCHGHINDFIVPSYSSISLIEDSDFRKFIAGFYDQISKIIKERFNKEFEK